MKPAKSLNSNHRWSKFIWLGLIVLTVLIVFSPVLKNGFISWDDGVHVVDNADIRSIDPANIQNIFTSTATRGYIPLTIFSFALEHHFFGLNPFVFHLDNLILHVIVTALVFFLGLRLGLNAMAAGLAALIFGIHPMHVESVAWVTARKDVLCGIFYLLALHSYWSYLEHGRKRSYTLTIILGILSMLAKPMAISLPLALWIIDFMKGRRFTPAVIWEKAPHLLSVAAIAMVTYRLYPREPVSSSVWEMALTWVWSLMFYPAKFLWPDHFFLSYGQPDPVSLGNPLYLFAVGGLMVFVLILIRFRTQRWLMFASLFYVCSIFFLLRGSVSESVALADRYMYLPSIGLCFLIGYFFDQLWNRWERKRLLKTTMSIILIVCAGILSVKAFRQAHVWKDSLTLWNHVLQCSPENNTGYYARGDVYKQMGKHHLALVDMTRSLAIMPNLAVEYFNRGTLFDDIGRKDWALRDYEAAIKVNPKHLMSYNNQAFIYFDRKQYQDAIEVLTRGIVADPKFAETFYNRGSVYAQLGDWDAALKDYDAALEVNPRLKHVYENRSRVWSAKQEWAKALADARKAQSLGVTYTPEAMAELERNAN